MKVNQINLKGDHSAALTNSCDSEGFRVHKYFLCFKSSFQSSRLYILIW